MSKTLSTTSSSAIAAASVIPDDIASLLGTEPDSKSERLKFVILAQGMSDAKDASKIDRYVPGLTDGGWAVPDGAGGYELFPDGFAFQSVMMEPIGVERDLDGQYVGTYRQSNWPSRDLLERVEDAETGYKTTRFRISGHRLESQFFCHMLIEGRLAASYRFKGSGYSEGRKLDNVVSRHFHNGLFAPMAILFGMTSEKKKGERSRGDYYVPVVERLGDLGRAGGPSMEWFARAAKLRHALETGGVVESLALEPPAPPAESAPAIGAPPRVKQTVTSGRQTPGTVTDVGEGPRPFAPLPDGIDDIDFGP
jgi:hypothetical protein